MNVNLNDDSLNIPSQEEREVVEYLAEVVISICNPKRFEYEEKTTSDLYYDQYDNEGDETEEEEEISNESERGSDYELEHDLKKQHHELSNFSLDFMQRVVDFANEEAVSGKRRRAWKSIKHRF